MLRRVPGSIDVLTSETLEASHVFTTSEALRKVPGLNLRDEEGLGLRPNIGIRGLIPHDRPRRCCSKMASLRPTRRMATTRATTIRRSSGSRGSKCSRARAQIGYGPVDLGGVVNYITPDPPARRSTALTLEAGNRDFLQRPRCDSATRWGRTGLLVDVMRKQSDGARERLHSDLNDVTVKVTRQMSPRQNAWSRPTTTARIRKSRIAVCARTSIEPIRVRTRSATTLLMAIAAARPATIAGAAAAIMCVHHDRLRAGVSAALVAAVQQFEPASERCGRSGLWRHGEPGHHLRQ